MFCSLSGELVAQSLRFYTNPADDLRHEAEVFTVVIRAPVVQHCRYF